MTTGGATTGTATTAAGGAAAHGRTTMTAAASAAATTTVTARAAAWATRRTAERRPLVTGEEAMRLALGLFALCALCLAGVPAVAQKGKAKAVIPDREWVDVVNNPKLAD